MRYPRLSHRARLMLKAVYLSPDKRVVEAVDGPMQDLLNELLASGYVTGDRIDSGGVLLSLTDTGRHLAVILAAAPELRCVP